MGPGGPYVVDFTGEKERALAMARTPDLLIRNQTFYPFG
jgi:hypothetical protein